MGRILRLVRWPLAAAADDVVHQIMAESAAGIGQAIGIFARGGVEQDARGLERLRAKDYGFGADLLDLAGEAIDVGDAGGFVRGVVHIDVADDGVGDECAIFGIERVLDGGERAAEIGERDAAAFARAAIVAWEAAVMRLREDGGAADGDGTAEFGLDAVP